VYSSRRAERTTTVFAVTMTPLFVKAELNFHVY